MFMISKLGKSVFLLFCFWLFFCLFVFYSLGTSLNKSVTWRIKQSILSNTLKVCEKGEETLRKIKDRFRSFNFCLIGIPVKGNEEDARLNN